MKSLSLLLTAALLVVTGCASYQVTQTDLSPDRRQIQLEVRALTLFSSSQNISRIRATQTDKTQSFGTESVGQSGATNTVAAIQALTTLIQTIRP